MLIDSHCHLPHKKYTRSISEILADAKSEGVEKVINIGTSIKENKEALSISSNYESVYSALAIYPHDDRGKDPDELVEALYVQLKSSKKVVALGECGIDISNWEGGRDIKEQLPLFEKQLILALRLNLPVVIHNNNGNEYVLELVKKYSNQGLRGVSHCFKQDWDYASRLLDYGFHISFTANITYPSNRHLLETVEKIPMDRFLLETDAPYLPPQAHRGTVNEPKYVKIVCQKVAETKKASFEEIEQCSYQNTVSFYKL